jgi:8-oxo-dGTP diphosphatase
LRHATNFSKARHNLPVDLRSFWVMSEEEFARPALTVDVALLAGDAPRRVLLIQRLNPPFEGMWALPGGFVDEGETVVAAAERELREETGVSVSGLKLLGVYDTPGRDPRGWSVSVVFVLTVGSELAARGGDDAGDARWFASDVLPELAFDHKLIVSDALRSTVA